MTDETLEEIRERKLQQLVESAGDTTQNSPSEPIHVQDDSHLEELVSENAVVLADFHADWCGPCKMLAPTVEELAKETDATIAKIDIDELQTLSGTYQVRSVPTLILFADGNPAERFRGVQQKEHLETVIDRHSSEF